MILNEYNRVNLSTTIKPDKLPKLYYEHYVIYSITNNDVLLVGYNNHSQAVSFYDSMLKCGRYAIVINEFPYEAIYV